MCWRLSSRNVQPSVHDDAVVNGLHLGADAAGAILARL